MANTDTRSQIYDTIRAWSNTNHSDVAPYQTILAQLLHKGFSERQLRDTIEEYEQMGILVLSSEASTITFNKI